MTPHRAFELSADSWRKRVEPVLGHAHAAINLMATGSAKHRAKEACGEVREMCAEFERLTLWLMPLAVTYSPDMDEAQLRAWARAVHEEMTR